MSFFEKLKTSVLHSGPPTLPRRTENSTTYGCPEEEFEEDGDTYEAPPCERPTIKVQPRQVEENVYLGYPDRTPNPAIPKRQAAPPPRPAKSLPIAKSTKPEPPHDPEEFYIDPNDGKPPEVMRKDKPGKKAPPKRPPMRPPPTPQHDEDVYLDPNEGQDDDDTYLEPVPETPSPRNPIRMPMPPKSIGRDPPPQLIKPPVPRAHSSSLLISDKAPPPEVKLRSSTLSGQLPPPVLNSKPVPPIIVPKELKPSPPPPQSLDSTALSFGMKPAAQGAGLQDREWFAGVCDRRTSEETVFRINKDGTFLVRYSNSQNDRQPYTLVVLYRQTVYNIPVRFLEDSKHYALGKEGKKTEELFGSLQEMISHHMKNPLLLIDRKSQAKHSTLLSHAVRP
ncbi:B-cell linker protein [Pseudorasbora parva]|uniref:B-cell linker protein n=1 Tax=Pseudorasbora parva TaxID=51549 RepID=UPI00351EDA83